MLALIAGTGRLPSVVVEHLIASGEAAQIWALEGHEPTLPEGHTAQTFRLETLGTFLGQLKEDGITSVCFAGAIWRPKLDPSLVDAATLPLLEQVVGALRAGDDGALRVAMGFFEARGIVVKGVHEICPDLLMPAGVPTDRKPTDAEGADAGRAAGLMAALGAQDVGQACVVGAGQVLAIETVQGTDWMLETLAHVPSERLSDPGTEGRGLFFKAPKPSQDRRADLPTIGPDTIVACAKAGLRGIVIEEGGVMALDRAEMLETANNFGLFVWVRRSEETPA